MVWLGNLQQVLTKGSKNSPRGKDTLELLNHTSVVDMKYPVVTIKQRKMGYRFMCAEALWILEGRNDISIGHFSQHIKNFSDDGYRFQGAYGPKVTEQLRYVCETITADWDTRQAIISVWREQPRPSKDIPCTLTLQFLVRKNKTNYPMIHCVANMRSSDLWLGWVYDVFNFTMITAWVVTRIREMTGTFLGMGNLYLNAGSQHIYDINIPAASVCLNQGESAGYYDPLDIESFINPYHLMTHLMHLRDRQWIEIGASRRHFLRELEHYGT